MSDLICIDCCINHTEIDLTLDKYPAIVGRCFYCDTVKVGVDYLSILQEDE